MMVDLHVWLPLRRHAPSTQTWPSTDTIPSEFNNGRIMPTTPQTSS